MMLVLKYIFTLLFFLAMPLLVAGQQNLKSEEVVTGTWLVGNKKARIEIFKAFNGFFHGKIVWMNKSTSDDGKPLLDDKNPDPAKRKNLLLGLQILRDFKSSGLHLWTGGKIYDPESGSDYQCKMTLENENTLHVRGFIGFSVFGRTDTWKRVN
jgi:uncharacterized protein (DUF2147 family)